MPYANPIARKLITNYKYSGARCLEESLRALLKRYATEIGKPAWTELKDLTIVSVPTSETRLRERGFDHAAVIAQIVRDEWAPNATIKQILKRNKQIFANAKLQDENARQANVSGAFEVIEQVSGPVLLLDDVYTTGATTRECTKVLMNAGAESVSIFTLAKG
jgi:competence protein ComFC